MAIIQITISDENQIYSIKFKYINKIHALLINTNNKIS